MKLNLKAPIAAALMITAMAFANPVVAEETSAADKTANCVVSKDGFAWNVCGNKLRGKQVAAAQGGAPAGAGPNPPAGGAPISISVFGFSIESGPAPFDPEDNGSNPHGGGGDGGR